MQHDEYLRFVDNLMRLMDEKGMTRYRLAKLMPCSPSTIANWFAGSYPRGLTRTRLLEVLEVTEEELYGEYKSPAPEEGEAVSKVASDITQFLLTLPADRLRGILLALGAPEDLLSELDRTAPK